MKAPHVQTTEQRFASEVSTYRSIDKCRRAGERLHGRPCPGPAGPRSRRASSQSTANAAPEPALDDERRALVVSHIQLALDMAEQQARRYRSSEEGELQSVAFFALCCAAVTYDLEGGMPFEDHAGPIIRDKLFQTKISCRTRFFSEYVFGDGEPKRRVVDPPDHRVKDPSVIAAEREEAIDPRVRLTRRRRRREKEATLLLLRKAVAESWIETALARIAHRVSAETASATVEG